MLLIFNIKLKVKTFKKVKILKKVLTVRVGHDILIVVARERQRPLKTEQDEPSCRENRGYSNLNNKETINLVMTE